MRETDAFCTYKGNKICDGAVTKEYKTMVQLCENGGLKYKKLEKVKPGYPLAGNGKILKISSLASILHNLNSTGKMFQIASGMMRSFVTGMLLG